MAYRLAFAFLPRAQHQLAGVVHQLHRAALADVKVTRSQLAAVDQCQRRAVGEHCAKLLDQIERQRRPTGSQGVQHAHLRIEADALGCAAAVVSQHRVQKRQHCVQCIPRWPARAYIEWEAHAQIGSQKQRKCSEVHASGIALDTARGVQIWCNAERTQTGIEMSRCSNKSIAIGLAHGRRAHRAEARCGNCESFPQAEPAQSESALRRSALARC